MTQNASSPVAITPTLASSEPTPDFRILAAEGLELPNRDRIAEAYLGRWGSPATQERARGRVDWMASCVEGQRILDIGCSEGILALLLARAGYRVVGVDIEPAAIATAQRLLSEEPAAVGARVELCVADALTADLGMGAFDTVILGEVLEHLADPAAMLECAAALLKPGGRLVLTTPFGHFPHPDHRQEFRTTELIELLVARFVIDELTIVDGYFRASAHTLAAPVLERRRAPEASELLRFTEEAAIAAQKHLHAQLALKESRLAVSIEKERALAARERALAEKLRRLDHQLEHQKRVTATAQSRLQQTQLELKWLEKGLRQELGRAMEKSLRSPLGLFRLPLRIAKAYRRAHRRAEAGLVRPSSLAEWRDGTGPAVLGSKTRSQLPPKLPHRDISSAFPPYAFPDRRPRCAVRVATILDEFSDACFRYEAELIRLTKENWREQLDRDRPQFLFVESAWRGNRENWRGLIKHASHTLDNPFAALVEHCKSRGIPTVFWNKEDPPSFEVFIDAAAKFDYVFTTDANCLERYGDRLGHDRIAALPFAAQPAIHNPIGKQESDDYEIAFAGTWYGQKHEERGALLPLLLDAAAEHNLHIFDRMSHHTRNEFYRFPAKYAAFLRTALAYPNVLSAYRNFKVFLNVNSVTDSPTMFARRVFEILASSTAVVSTASTGIEQMLGDVVSLVHDEREAHAELDRLLSDSAYRQRKAHLGCRKVTREHTYAARFRTVAHTIGLDVDALRGVPAVSVVVPIADERWFDNALANVRRQRYARMEPVWVLRGDSSRLAERVAREYPWGATVRVGADASLAGMLRCGIEASRGALVTVFDPRDLYGPEFIGDLVLAMTYADAEVVGKAAYFTTLRFDQSPTLCQPSSCYRYVDEVTAAAWLVRRDLLNRVAIDQVLRVEDGRPCISRARAAGRIYCADPYNYLRFEDPEMAAAASAAPFGTSGLSGICGAAVMI